MAHSKQDNSQIKDSKGAKWVAKQNEILGHEIRSFHTLRRFEIEVTIKLLFCRFSFKRQC